MPPTIIAWVLGSSNLVMASSVKLQAAIDTSGNVIKSAERDSAARSQAVNIGNINATSNWIKLV
jgi:hypothetical protein